MAADAPPPRHILSAEILSIGSELTVGDTRDTNAGELARSLTQAGVIVGRITALPDRLDAIVDAWTSGLERADLVVSTGGLGPTPDDLTREAIARVCAETPATDPDLERWLRALWRRRKLPFPEANLKQAWLIPSATALPNPNGTAPGWYVARPDGRVLVALPGPPREMRPMWLEHALPRLRANPGGFGTTSASTTLRLTGIGESQVAERLADLIAADRPEVATYARADAVDVRVSAVGDSDGSAADIVAAATIEVESRLREFIWARGDASWATAIGDRLAARGWTLAIAEIGTRGQMGALLGDADWLIRDDSRLLDRAGHPAAAADAEVLGRARTIRSQAGASVGAAVEARDRGGDTTVTIAVVTPDGERVERRLAFLGGANGRTRAALAAAAVLLESLPAADPIGLPPDARD